MIPAIKIIFWICLSILFYSYFGYALLSYFLVVLKKKKNETIHFMNLPEVTILIAAYNEKDFIKNKIENLLNLKYPKDKLKIIIVTDGSNDGTEHVLKLYPEITHLHKEIRLGKISAMERAIPYVQTPILIFTDANNLLNEDAIENLVRHFSNDKVGAVAGEKRILNNKQEGAIVVGEGIYWKYESFLKKIDSKLYSVVGAAGELYAIRTILYKKIPKDIIIEDFYLTMKITELGYKVVYEPNAYSIETASESLKEELKRKIRIAAGGIQAISRLRNLLNPFKFGILTFQYISHRVLRWTVAPASLPLVFLSNFILAVQQIPFYKLFFILQAIFYVLAFLGILFEKSKVRLKVFFIPFYFLIMNYAVYIGFLRHLKGTQTVLWEKAKRGL